MCYFWTEQNRSTLPLDRARGVGVARVGVRSNCSIIKILEILPILSRVQAIFAFSGYVKDGHWYDDQWDDVSRPILCSHHFVDMNLSLIVWYSCECDALSSLLMYIDSRLSDLILTLNTVIQYCVPCCSVCCSVITQTHCFLRYLSRIHLSPNTDSNRVCQIQIESWMSHNVSLPYFLQSSVCSGNSAER